MKNFACLEKNLARAAQALLVFLEFNHMVQSTNSKMHSDASEMAVAVQNVKSAEKCLGPWLFPLLNSKKIAFNCILFMICNLISMIKGQRVRK